MQKTLNPLRTFLAITGILLIVNAYAFADTIAPMHTATLHPRDTAFFTRAGNVIQGIANWKGYWITTQHHKNRLLIFNVLDQRGRSRYAKRITYASHGQDLGVKQLDDHHLLLVTRGDRKGTIATFILTYGDSLAQTRSIRHLATLSLPVGRHKTTPTFSTDGKTLLVYSGGTIHLFETESLGKNAKGPKKIGKFKLHEKQRKKKKWFQGIAMHRGKIYCLTADNSLKNDKYLYVYDPKGKLLEKHRLTFGKQYARRHGVKWEMEGLAFKGDDLYTVVISGFNGLNIKHLYRILHVSR